MAARLPRNSVGPTQLHDQTGDQQITVGFTARITISGSAQLTNTAASASIGRCDAQISDGTGPDNGYAIGLPLSGSVVKPPGTYNVRVYCAAGGMRLDQANLAVIAVAA